MPQTVKKNAEERMEKAILSLRRDLASLRAGRASTALLDRIQVEYYGSPTPINQLANISTPDSRTLLIQPWDKTSMSDIERAIMKSDLGLTPANDGTIIRLSIPALTEERRSELVKFIKKFGEEANQENGEKRNFGRRIPWTPGRHPEGNG
jgi:ribosome recycling factor